MKNYYYDLHIHSCLSPCGDDDMTPGDIAGMAKVKGLDIIALTDHNTCKNCPAFFASCKAYGIIPVAGMELTTAEDIHIICLFPELEKAMSFDGYVDSRRIRIKNREEIFGKQIIYGENDSITGYDEYLLPNATELSLEEAAEKAREYGAAVYPAHIDRESNGIIATLGMLPDKPYFSAVEYREIRNKPEYEEKYALKGKKTLCSSDAHRLWDINERENFLAFEGDKRYIARRLIEYIGL